MLRIVAEQMDNTGTVTLARTETAISAEPRIAGNMPEAGSVQIRQSAGVVINIPVSGDPTDFQRVRVYGNDGTIVWSLAYKDGVVAFTDEQTVDR